MKNSYMKALLLSLVSLGIVLVVPFILIYHNLFGFPWHYLGWQEVNINNIGTFRVPGDWVIKIQGNELYFTDKPLGEDDIVIYFAGNYFEENISIMNVTATEVFELGEITYSNFISSEGWSSSVSYRLDLCVIDRVETNRYILDFYSGNEGLYLFSYGDVVNYELIRKIAKSYSME